MNAKVAAVLLSGMVFSAAAWADPLPKDASFSTLIITPLAIEGLTGDAAGNLYTTGRKLLPTQPLPPAPPIPGEPCPVWRINVANPVLETVGFIPNPTGCNPSGLTFDAAGNLYIGDSASGGVVWKLAPDAGTKPLATSFATRVPGANGLAFDRDGNLFISDATTGQGRVWRISAAGAVCDVASPVNCSEAFRIQPMANEVNLVAGIGGVGRDVRTLPPGTVTVTATSRNATNTLGSQPLVANGLAFDREGDLYVADTARGAIWQARFDRRGELRSRTGCDTTFTANTLCMESVFVAHPLLEGTDGIALDRAGNIWNSANERNAIVVVTRHRRVTEVFRNEPAASTNLRNAGPLEFPTSPFLLGRKLCTANSDGNRRDNSPNAAGEVNSGAAQEGARGKISCMDEALTLPGLPLPVR